MSAVAISSASCCSESGDVNEYAFALGALSHYAADIAGHPAVNQAVAIEYPKPTVRRELINLGANCHRCSKLCSENKSQHSPAEPLPVRQTSRAAAFSRGGALFYCLR
jgi:hypothetical protein